MTGTTVRTVREAEAGVEAPPLHEVRLIRGSEAESVHVVHGVVVGLRDGEEARFGEPELAAYWRSALKPFQALAVVEEGAAERFGFDSADLALCCASHGGGPAPVERIGAMLARMGLDEEDLACGAHRPLDEHAAHALSSAGVAPGRLHNNCSGKHAGMLALALVRGWELRGYERPDHLVQARLRWGLARWLDVDPEELAWARDGCGVPTPYVSLRQMARAYARLVRAADREHGAPRTVVAAMTSNPELTSASERIPLALMRATGGRLLAKEGAEGVLCAGAPTEGWGLALKVVDGARRATGPAAVAVLASLGLLGGEERERLAEEAVVPQCDTRGLRVGELRARMVPHLAPVAGRL